MTTNADQTIRKCKNNFHLPFVSNNPLTEGIHDASIYHILNEMRHTSVQAQMPPFGSDSLPHPLQT